MEEEIYGGGGATTDEEHEEDSDRGASDGDHTTDEEEDSYSSHFDYEHSTDGEADEHELSYDEEEEQHGEESGGDRRDGESEFIATTTGSTTIMFPNEGGQTPENVDPRPDNPMPPSGTEGDSDEQPIYQPPTPLPFMDELRQHFEGGQGPADEEEEEEKKKAADGGGGGEFDGGEVVISLYLFNNEGSTAAIDIDEVPDKVGENEVPTSMSGEGLVVQKGRRVSITDRIPYDYGDELERDIERMENAGESRRRLLEELIEEQVRRIVEMIF